jgi:hypothetical protein
VDGSIDLDFGWEPFAIEPFRPASPILIIANEFEYKKSIDITDRPVRTVIEPSFAGSIDKVAVKNLTAYFLSTKVCQPHS